MNIFVKLFTSILIVISIAEISKRINPILGGLVSGLPLGTGLSVYFISYKFGSNYLLEVIPWGICGLISSIIFCFIYLYTDMKLDKKNKIISILISSFAAIIFFMLTGYLLYEINITLVLSVLLFFVSINS
jgi:uncharacterized membrane protein (GlpM family)